MYGTNQHLTDVKVFFTKKINVITKFKTQKQKQPRYRYRTSLSL